MSCNPPETGPDEPRVPASSGTSTQPAAPSRVVRLAQACTQIANSSEADAVYGALDAALSELFGPSGYGLWRRCAPDLFERLNPAAPASFWQAENSGGGAP